MIGQREWTIPCVDGVGRPRVVRVYLAESNGLGLTLPAGESAVLDYNGAVELLTAAGRVLGLIRYPAPVNSAGAAPIPAAAPAEADERAGAPGWPSTPGAPVDHDRGDARGDDR